MQDDEAADIKRAQTNPAMIDRIDHFVLTVRSFEATCAFYEDVLGMERIDAKERPTASALGRQKINIHEIAHTFEPKAATPTSGAGDFCLMTMRSINEPRAHLDAHGVSIEVGPVARDGASGRMTSLYLWDPDGNLVEISRYDD